MARKNNKHYPQIPAEIEMAHKEVTRLYGDQATVGQFKAISDWHIWFHSQSIEEMPERELITRIAYTESRFDAMANHYQRLYINGVRAEARVVHKHIDDNRWIQFMDCEAH